MLKLGFPCFGLEIGLGHIFLSFLDIDMMARLSNGIWNWIGVYLRSLPNNKVLLFLKILKLKELNKV